MVWVRLDDGYPEHPKVDRVGPLAAWLNVCAWAYCARNLTDGFVPLERVDRLASVPKPRELVRRLVDARLWESTEGGYLVHDYLDYNPSREQVHKERAATAQRVAQHRYNARSNTPSNGVTSPVTNVVSNGPGTDVSNGGCTAAPYPVPVKDVKDPAGSSPAGLASPSLAGPAPRTRTREAAQDPPPVNGFSSMNSLMAEHQRRVASERASQAMPSQPIENSLNGDGRDDG